MSAGRVLILGASGFVGTTLVERMWRRPDWDVVPVIHSAGSAWRLARHGRPLLALDLDDRAALRAALQGATHVVNCTRGGREVMIDGLANVLTECRRSGVKRLVHLSSVLVYGDPPMPASEHEDGPVDARQPAMSYGGMKLEQDRMVEHAASRGLASVVLCPPNISGPFSLYLCAIVDAMRKHSFALVGDGAGPCNIVDVRTLCSAIEAALTADPSVADGKRMFVTDGEPTTWNDVVEELRSVAEVDEIRTVDRELLATRVRQQQAAPAPSVSRAIMHLVSSNVREALRKDPLLARVDRVARAGVARLGSGVEERLRRGIEGVTAVPRIDPLADLQVGLCAQQLRQVFHGDDRVRQALGFAPPVGFKASMADFRRWYRVMYGVGGAERALARRLSVE
jgi:nucleoside-diphosphate-sugar epimerase